MSFFAAFIRRQFFFTPPEPTWSFAGKTVIVTGSNVGLGKEACRWIIRLGAEKVIIACRSIEKGQAAAAELKESTNCKDGVLNVWQIDLASYASVVAFAEKAKTELPRLDVLICNAGIHAMKFTLFEDNESTITTNVVSTFLLAFLLHPKLQETAQRHGTHTHLTVTASELHEVAGFKERNVPDGQIFEALNDSKSPRMMDRYNVSKLLDCMMVRQMGQMSPFTSSGVIINSVAPGACKSELTRELGNNFLIRFLKWVFFRTTEVGSRTLVYGAGAGAETHGEYLPDCKITPLRGLAHGEKGVELQRRVWEELSAKLEVISPGVTKLADKKST